MASSCSSNNAALNLTQAGSRGLRCSVFYLNDSLKTGAVAGKRGSAVILESLDVEQEVTPSTVSVTREALLHSQQCGSNTDEELCLCPILIILFIMKQNRLILIVNRPWEGDAGVERRVEC